MEQQSFSDNTIHESTRMYGGTVLALLAETEDSLPIRDMAGPPTFHGTSITTTPKTGPDKNGQYTQDSDSDSNIDTDPSES